MHSSLGMYIYYIHLDSKADQDVLIATLLHQAQCYTYLHMYHIPDAAAHTNVVF